MTFSSFLSFCVTCIALMLGFISETDQHPQLKKMSIEWLDAFTVNVSWETPSVLKNSSDVQYQSSLTKGDNYHTKIPDKITTKTSFTDLLLTEDSGSDRWTYNICLVNTSDCVKKTINTTRAKVVKDFKCFVSLNRIINCSWIPVNNSPYLQVFYRHCGSSVELINTTRECNSSGEQNGCYLPTVASNESETCILVKTQTEAGISTFKAALAVHPPNLTVTKQGEKLNLSWTRPDTGAPDCWRYTICYNECDKRPICKNTSSELTTMDVLYDKRCRYNFTIKTWTSTSCLDIRSDFSEAVIYGTNEPPDGTQTVVVIVIPIILFMCVILSFYCLRRHSDIICPIVPDPSAIFKEMMMNGNKEHEAATGSLYTPMPEPIEPCKIILVAENSPLQPNL